jgi:hypothetical protein
LKASKGKYVKFMQRYIFISIFVALITLFCISCSATSSPSTVINPSVSNAKPTPSPTPYVRPASAVKSIPTVAEYYQAIKEKNYTLAYTFVAAGAKNSSGQLLTENTFLQMAQTSDAESGAIVNVVIDPVSNDSTQILLTIDRSSSLHYHAHLTLKQEGNTWKITLMDRI